MSRHDRKPRPELAAGGENQLRPPGGVDHAAYNQARSRRGRRPFPSSDIMSDTLPATLGELRAQGYQSRSVKSEMRSNLLAKLRAREPLFPGIVGYDETVVPQVENAILNAILTFDGDRAHAVGIFCHGLKGSLQTGHNLTTLAALARALTKSTHSGAKVVLYACSAADTPVKNGPGGDDGFADRLRDALIRHAPGHWKGGHVDAHVTAGHATTNPYVRRFTCDLAVPSETVLGIVGGEWIVPPGSKWWKAWDAALHGDLRFRFPFMSISEIRAELER